MKPIRSCLLFTLAATGLGVAGPSFGSQPQPYAHVVSSTPIVVQAGAPREECWDVQRPAPAQTSGGGALIGAIIGGVIGNQLGGGSGRIAATGLGAVGGAAIGNQVEADRSVHASVQRHCRTVTGSASRVVGYDVVYEYAGQRHHTRTATDPGPRIAVDVRPAAAPIAYQPVPAVTTTTRPETYVESLPPAQIDGPTAPYTVAPVVVYRSAPYPYPYGGYVAYPYGYGPGWYGAPYWGPTFSIGIGHWHGHHRHRHRHRH